MLSPTKWYQKASSLNAFSKVSQQVTPIGYGSAEITKNLKPEAGLANSTTSSAMDIVWEELVTDKNISDVTKLFKWIDFGSDYKGESFFPNIPEQRG